MTLSEELLWRGFVDESTMGDLTLLDQKQWTYYQGFDVSADALSTGNLAALMLNRTFLRYGHSPILLIGGGTTLVGDPGGNLKERELIDERLAKSHVKAIQKQITKILGRKVKFANNMDWLKDIKLLPFLRDVGKQFGMTPLVQQDDVAARIDNPNSEISYAEFTYTILQGYDYLRLYNKFGCTLQIGGADQWGNCLSGVELVQRQRGAEVHALTMPMIINDYTGAKFGKSQDDDLWLDESKTRGLVFYHFWLNVNDNIVEEYLKIFTEYDKSQIEVLMAEFQANTKGQIAQRALAYEVTKLVHGKKRADEVKKVTEILFGDEDFHELAKNQMDVLKRELPVVKATDQLSEVIAHAGLAADLADAKQYLDKGEIYINRQKAGPDNLNLFVNGNNLLQRGKTHFAIVEK